MWTGCSLDKGTGNIIIDIDYKEVAYASQKHKHQAVQS